MASATHLLRERARSARAPSLLAQVLLVNAAVVAFAALLLAVTPVRISAPVTPHQLAVIVGGSLVMLLVDVVLVRRAMRPLESLVRRSQRIDGDRPQERLPVPSGPGEVARLSHAINDMLARLDDERRESARRAFAAQENERRRVARELHDEVGQQLTASVLSLELIAIGLPDAARPQLDDAIANVQQSLGEVRRLARELRPEALDELGLINALIALCTRLARQSSVAVRHRIAASPNWADPDPELELAVYRVAQEAMTNSLRHAGAGTITLGLDRTDSTLVLTVRDDGRGLDPAAAAAGSGLNGMRERAQHLHATLDVDGRPDAGTCVRLTVPLNGR